MDYDETTAYIEMPNGRCCKCCEDADCVTGDCCVGTCVSDDADTCPADEEKAHEPNTTENMFVQDNSGFVGYISESMWDYFVINATEPVYPVPEMCAIPDWPEFNIKLLTPSQIEIRAVHTVQEGGGGCDFSNPVRDSTICHESHGSDYSCDSNCECTIGPICGNDVCESGETSWNCCSDCGCPSNYCCSGGRDDCYYCGYTGTS
jgi:hypothetical protein